MCAANLQPIERGWIFVAPPDRHLVLEPGLMRLDAGPKEHHTRPAADPLFCSAAAAYGPRVVGVVLTGGDGDGASGLIAIQQKGGIAIVQDPDDAVDPSMPQHALDIGQPNYSLPLTEIAPFLVRLITGLEDDERSR
jgi:two-component system, chemotaxis family, protein-glutamate methylesterase/glutaminase